MNPTITNSASKIIGNSFNELFANVKSHDDYALVYETVNQLKSLCDQNVLKEEDIHNYLREKDPEFIERTRIGHSLAKPYGYAGDFFIINQIYEEHTTEVPSYKIWDKFFQSLDSCDAVRNRRIYLTDLINTLFNGQQEFHLLNLASGPARDLNDVYQQIADSDQIHTTCVDMDPDAIKFGQKITADYSNRIKFIKKNIFRFQTEEKYDLIWSAGLFDYFDDATFVRILKRMKTWMKPGGQIVVGNFNETYNPSRAVMELLGDWYLNHRTELQLTNIAVEAGFSRAAISVGREEQNVNLFLHMR